MPLPREPGVVPVGGGSVGPCVETCVDLFRRAANPGIRCWPEMPRKHRGDTRTCPGVGGGMFLVLIHFDHLNI